MLLEFVEQGFVIQDLCAKKGVFLNRPKENGDSDETLISRRRESTFHWPCEKL